MNDGVIAQDVSVFGGEVRIPVEVWKDGHMLFPEYDGEIGQKNLLLNTKRAVASDSYLLATYPLQDKTLEEGEPVSIILSGVLGQGKSHFTAYNSGSSAAIAGLTTIVGNTYSRSTTWKKTRSDGIIVHNSSLWVYHMLNSVTGVTSSIDWIKLVRGSVIPEVWTPAPEELLELATIRPVNCSYRIENNEIVLSGFTENRGYVDIEISYGEGWTRTKRVNFHRKNRIQDIQVKGKRPYRAYLGNNLIWHKYHERTQAIFDYANDRYFQLPTNRIAYDDYMRGLIKNGLFDKLDLHYIFSGDGDINFKLINVINPGVYNGTAFGGLEWSNEGVKGNGVNGYVDTNFNPFFGGEAYSHANASINAIISQAYSTNSRITGTRGNTTNSINNENTKSQYINSVTPDSSSESIDFRGTGLKSINRISEMIIYGVNKSIITESTQNINIGDFLSQRIFNSYHSSSPKYGDMKVSSFSMGASLTYEETQQFRQLFNKYLISNNLNPIA